MSTDQKRALSELEALLNEWTQTPMGRRAFLWSVPALMTACASGEKTRYREGDNTGQSTSMSVEDEKRMTQEVLPEMRKDYPPARNSELQSYVRGLGNNLVKKNSLEGQPYNYNFTVVDVPMVNAFALPAGTIFVTTPLIAMAETEAELVGVIGHEVGHVQARHTAERMDKAQKAQSKSWLFGLGGGILGGALGYGIGTLTCDKGDKKCMSKAMELGAVAGIGGGLLIQKYKFMANSREDEMEADRIGFRTAVRTGYSKDHVGRFYEKLLQMEQRSKRSGDGITQALSDALSTHPPSKERVRQMRQMASEVPRDKSARVSSRSFQKMRTLSSQLAQSHKKRT